MLLHIPSGTLYGEEKLQLISKVWNGQMDGSNWKYCEFESGVKFADKFTAVLKINIINLASSEVCLPLDGLNVMSPDLFLGILGIFVLLIIFLILLFNNFGLLVVLVDFVDGGWVVLKNRIGQPASLLIIRQAKFNIIYNKIYNVFNYINILPKNNRIRNFILDIYFLRKI